MDGIGMIVSAWKEFRQIAQEYKDEEETRKFIEAEMKQLMEEFYPLKTVEDRIVDEQFAAAGMPTDTKPTNPKDLNGVKKVPFHVLPWRPIAALAASSLLEGDWKYGSHNYRAMGVLASVYFDANFRHTIDWWEGSNSDPKSGHHPLLHSLACILIILDAFYSGKLEDDRPPAVHGHEWMEQLNEEVLELQHRLKQEYGPRTQPYTEKNYRRRIK